MRIYHQTKSRSSSDEVYPELVIFYPILSYTIKVLRHKQINIWLILSRQKVTTPVWALGLREFTLEVLCILCFFRVWFLLRMLRRLLFVVINIYFLFYLIFLFFKWWINFFVIFAIVGKLFHVWIKFV